MKYYNDIISGKPASRFIQTILCDSKGYTALAILSICCVSVC